MREPLFSLGQTVATPGALEVMARFGINPAALIARHVTGDWGDIDPEDRGLNEQALRDGSRIFSVYGEHGSDYCLWVITEAVTDPEADGPNAGTDPRSAPGMGGDRLATTILRPEDY